MDGKIPHYVVQDALASTLFVVKSKEQPIKVRSTDTLMRTNSAVLRNFRDFGEHFKLT